MTVPHKLATLIPSPRSAQPAPGSFTLPARAGVDAPDDWGDIVADLLPLRPDAREAAAITVSRDAALAEEDYRLAIGTDGVRIEATSAAGVRHACQTIVQLLPDACGLPAVPAGTERVLPCCTVEDGPRYRWRGMHLDVARHFLPFAWLFRYVDALALHKLNVLHLHLTDDQGWRFEVKKYPRLTEVGSWREGTRYPSWAEHDGIRRGGFYTQEQLRALVAYAASRGITVVPEVDVPGHVRSLLAAYPEFGRGEGRPVPTDFDIFEEVLWLSDATVAMVEDIYAELLEVFPSPIVHIGGDECPRAQWRGSDADALARSRGLESPEQLQRWFTRHLADWLAARGRRVMGWDEIVGDGDVPGVIVHAWRGVEPGLAALADGYEVLMAPSPTLYFDSYQSDSPDEPYGREPVRTWADVVSFDPAAGAAASDLPRLLGVQGQLWTEFIPDTAHAEYMAFPRACSLAQVGWSGPTDPAEFEPRLRGHLARLDARGIGFRPLDGPRPWQAGGTGARRREAW